MLAIQPYGAVRDNRSILLWSFTLHSIQVLRYHISIREHEEIKTKKHCYYILHNVLSQTRKVSSAQSLT